MNSSTSPENGSSQSHLTLNLGNIRICQLNVEGINKSKCEFLSQLLLNNDPDLIILQETHVENEEQLRARGRIPGYESPMRATCLTHLIHLELATVTILVKSTNY